MPLIERLMGFSSAGDKIPVHQFYSIASEWARGAITAAQAQEAVRLCSGTTMNSTDATEAQNLVTVVTSSTDPVQRLQKANRIHEVLLMAEQRLPPYDTAAATRTRLFTT